MSGIASPADLLVAFAKLRPADERTRIAIAAMLHLKRFTAAPSLSPSNPEDESPWAERASPTLLGGALMRAEGSASADAARPLEVMPQTVPGNVGTPPKARAESVVGDVREAVLEPVRASGSVGIRPGWLNLVDPLPPRHPSSTPPLIEPLFRPKQQRGILGAALATRSADGPLDTASVIRSLTALRPLSRLPRHPIPTLRRGAQLLVDVSTAMDPYAADTRELVDAISEVVGRYRIQVLTFFHAPIRRVYSLDGNALAWRVPPPGTPVLIISDFGIGGPLVNQERSRVGEWLRLARRAHAARCPVVALVPFPPHRWTPTLLRMMTWIQWDRGTTAGAVRRKVGPGHASG